MTLKYDLWPSPPPPVFFYSFSKHVLSLLLCVRHSSKHWATAQYKENSRQTLVLSWNWHPVGEINSKQTFCVRCQIFPSAQRQLGERTRGWRQCSFRFRRPRPSGTCGEHVWPAAGATRGPLWLEQMEGVNWRGGSPELLCCCFYFQSPVPWPSHLPPTWSQGFSSTVREEVSC